MGNEVCAAGAISNCTITDYDQIKDSKTFTPFCRVMLKIGEIEALELSTSGSIERGTIGARAGSAYRITISCDQVSWTCFHRTMLIELRLASSQHAEQLQYPAAIRAIVFT